MKRIVSITLYCLAINAGIVYAAGLDTSFRFSTIETRYFSIHYHQGLEETARKAASIAEDVHSRLVPEFGWQPREKTQIVLVDESDFTNGFAGVIPYNFIYLYTVPPALDLTIGEYDDWLRMLIVHEYIHVLTLDSARGYSEIMRRIFGKPLPADLLSFMLFIAAAPPNIFMPLWWQEGIATWGESEFTAGGRGKGSYYEMILRMAVAEKNIPSIDRLNGGFPDWPAGRTPYIYGMLMNKYIADKYGKDKPGALSRVHSGRFPYFINNAARSTIGRDYYAAYYEMLNVLKKEQGEKIKALGKEPLSVEHILALEGEVLTNPRFSKDGGLLAYNRRDPHDHEEIVIAEVSAPETIGSTEDIKILHRIRRLVSDHSISWDGVGTEIYFSQAEIARGFNIYQDLYSYNLETGKLKRLTHGMRVGEPDASTDGDRFAIVRTEEGIQNLGILSRDSGGFKFTRLTSYAGMKVSNPRWSPDGDKIAYVVKGNDGLSGIHLYDISDETDIVLFENADDNAYPTWSPDGKYIIYTSDRTGVFNIFAWSLEDRVAYQITHMMGGAFQPSISSDGRRIYYSSYYSKGFRIASIEYNPESWKTDIGPRIEPDWKEGSHSVERVSNRTISESGESYTESVYASHPYSIMGTILPRFWLPTLASDHKGGVPGAFTAGYDVIGYNSYIAQAGYGVESGRYYYNLTYINNYFYPEFTFQAYERPLEYTELLSDEDYFELDRSVIVGMTLPISFLESGYQFSLGYQFRQQSALSARSNENGPIPFEGYRSNLFAGIEFSNTLRYPKSISHEEGRSISFLHRYYSRETGSDLSSREYIGSYSEYINLNIGDLRHDVLFLKVKGAYSSGDSTAQQSFHIGGLPSDIAADFPLRGYPSRFESGQYAAVGTVEYRLPLTNILKGSGTNPLFFEKLHTAVFADAGEVWEDSDGLSTDHVKVGAGIEARLDMIIGYRLRITPAIGIARGFSQDGGNILYINIYTDL